MLEETRQGVDPEEERKMRRVCGSDLWECLPLGQQGSSRVVEETHEGSRRLEE